MTAEDARPWWASTDPQTEGLDTEEDPIEVLRAARRPDAEHGGPDVDSSRSDADGSRSNANGSRSDAAGGEPHTDDLPSAADSPHTSEICGVCPLCVGWRFLQEHHPDVVDHLAAAGRHLADAQPEVAEHLGAAGRHLTAAFRKLIDERGESGPDGGSDRDHRDGPGRKEAFEHIVLDDEEDQA